MDQKCLLSTYTKGIINITTFIKKICDSFTKEKKWIFKNKKETYFIILEEVTFFFKNVYY